MGSHSVTCHPTEVRIPLPPAEANTRFSDPGGMQGWVDLCYVKATGRELNPRPVNREFNALPLSHHATVSLPYKRVPIFVSYSVVLVDNRHVCLVSPLGVTLSKFRKDLWLRKIDFPGHRTADDTFRRFDRCSTCHRRIYRQTDRRTDGQTDGRTDGYSIYRCRIALCGKKVKVVGQSFICRTILRENNKRY